ncbi:MAG: hypothetical protein U1F67_01050 [Rubrivivax sp.]
MSVVRKYLLIFGGIFFLMSALQLGRFFTERSDIWWTPQALAVPLAGSADRVRVYVDDVALEDLVRAGRIRVLAASEATPIAAPDIRLRFNNRDQVRAARIPALIGAAFAAGVARTGAVRRELRAR